jgi:hypothetical protein
MPSLSGRSCACQWVLSVARARLEAHWLAINEAGFRDTEGRKIGQGLSLVDHRRMHDQSHEVGCSPFPAGIEQEQLDMSEISDHWAKADVFERIVEALRKPSDFMR